MPFNIMFTQVYNRLYAGESFHFIRQAIPHPAKRPGALPRSFDTAFVTKANLGVGILSARTESAEHRGTGLVVSTRLKL